MTHAPASSYRGGALIGGLFLSLLAAACVAAVTQDGVRELLIAKVGGPGTFSAAVAALFLIGGLFSLRAGTGGTSRREVGERSRPVVPPLPRSSGASANVAVATPPPVAAPQPALLTKPQGARQLPLQWTDEDGNRQTKLVDVRGSSEHEFSLRVDGAFKVGQAVWVADEDILRRGVVKSFEEGSGPRRLDVQLISKERRGSERVMGAGQASLHWSEGEVACQSDVTVRNFSENGIQVLSSRPVTAGQSVVLKGQKLNSPALVLYCETEGDQHLVGLQFAGAMRSAVAPQQLPTRKPAEPTVARQEPSAARETVSALAERLSARPKSPRLILTAPNRMG